MYAYVLFHVSDHAYADEISAFPKVARRLLPDTFDLEPRRFDFGKSFTLFVWHQWNDPHGAQRVVNPGPVSSPSKGSFFSSGYTSEGMLSPDGGVFDLISSTEPFTLSDTPGGVGANLWISADQTSASCWSTQPQAIPTFYAKNRKGFIAVGNRPKLVHAASILGEGYRVNPAYFEKYLVSGFAVDGTMPYPGTHVVPPNRSLAIKDGNFTVAAYPILPPEPTPQERPLDEKAGELAKLLKEACWPAKAVGRSNLFLSGGKDSRALATALYGTRNIRAFTFGDSAIGEGYVARPVAQRLGADFEVRSQKIISDPLKAAAHSNLFTDGLGLNFAHQYNFNYDLTALEGLPSFHGHGHLLRGGFARTMSRDRAHLADALKAPFISAYTTDEANAPVAATLDAWFAERSPIFRDARDVLFYSNIDFRLGLFSAPTAIELTSRTFMVYPLLDEKVSRFAASLAVFDRVSERVVFGAMRMLARELTDLPLFGEIWRFDRSPDKRDFVDSDHNFQDGFELRQPREANKLEQMNGVESAFVYDADRSTFRNHRKTSAEFILSSTRSDDVRKLLRPHIMAEIEALATTGGHTAVHATRGANERFVIGSFINRVFVATTLVDLR